MFEDKKHPIRRLKAEKKGRIEKRDGDLSPPLLYKERVQISS